MEPQPVTNLTEHRNGAAERNAAHNAARTRTVRDEATDAADHLWNAFPHLRDWYDAMTALKTAKPGQEMDAELMRLTRVSSIVGELVTKARANTAEAKRINRQRQED